MVQLVSKHQKFYQCSSCRQTKSKITHNHFMATEKSFDKIKQLAVTNFLRKFVIERMFLTH